jgi:putative transcriptional regulator
MQLLTLRTKAGWSQEFVARQMEVSRATIVNWERGNTEPSISEAVKLAKLFGITVEELMK